MRAPVPTRRSGRRGASSTSRQTERQGGWEGEWEDSPAGRSQTPAQHRGGRHDTDDQALRPSDAAGSTSEGQLRVVLAGPAPKRLSPFASTPLALAVLRHLAMQPHPPWQPPLPRVLESDLGLAPLTPPQRMPVVVLARECPCPVGMRVERRPGVAAHRARHLRRTTLDVEEREPCTQEGGDHTAIFAPRCA